VVDIVVFDFDGVVRFWDDTGIPALEFSAGLSEGAIEHFAFEQELLNNVVTGKITKQQWLSHIANELRCDRSIVAKWAMRPTKVDLPLLGIIQNIKAAGIKVYLASNGTDELCIELVNLRILDKFDGVFNSAEIGAAKPSSRFFQNLVDVLGASKRIVFIDDRSDNTATAATFGLESWLYRGQSGLSRVELFSRLNAFCERSAWTQQSL